MTYAHTIVLTEKEALNSTHYSRFWLVDNSGIAALNDLVDALLAHAEGLG